MNNSVISDLATFTAISLAYENGGGFESYYFW